VCRHGIDNALKQVNDRRRPQIDWTAVPCLHFHRCYELPHSASFGRRVEKMLKRFALESERVAPQAARDDPFPCRRHAVPALAQDVGVVDLANLDVSVFRAGPEPFDPAFAPDRVDGATEQQQKGAPGVTVSARCDRQLPDEVSVTQRRQFRDRSIGARQCSSFEQQMVRKNSQTERVRQLLRARSA
jgi:hypothetical protein